jgi:hypothetical protein
VLLAALGPKTFPPPRQASRGFGQPLAQTFSLPQPFAEMVALFNTNSIQNYNNVVKYHCVLNRHNVLCDEGDSFPWGERGTYIALHQFWQFNYITKQI